MFDDKIQTNNQNEKPAMPTPPSAPPENINQRIERLHEQGKLRKNKKAIILAIVLFVIIAGGASAGFMYRDKIGGFLGIGGENNCDYDNPNKEYKYKNLDECSRAFIVCDEGEEIFGDNCGCGCEVVQEEQVFCAQDAKQCPDGSFVSRIAPDCEFAECPALANDCAKEGDVISTSFPTDIQCCEGLKKIDVGVFDINYCTKCGDEICKDPENKLGCPEDCEEENIFNWESPIDLIKCNNGERRDMVYGLGSKNITVKGVKENNCIFEYTDEMEGGYTTYECSIANSITEVIPSGIDVDNYCSIIKSGNMLQELSMAGWQTYRNEEYEFEFKYPNDYDIKKYNDGDRFVLISPHEQTKIDSDIGTEIFVDTIKIDEFMDFPAIEEIVKSLAENTGLNESGREKLRDEVLATKENFLVDESISGVFYNEGHVMSPYWAYVPLRDKNYTIVFNFVNRQFLYQILSTFKFLSDTDSDGLYDDEEEKYGTDMNNSDSDGDGYLDGSEVKSGYNPMGEGKLN